MPRKSLRHAETVRRHRTRPRGVPALLSHGTASPGQRPGPSAGKTYLDGVPVGAQTLPGRLAQPTVVRPGAVRDVGDEDRTDPLRLSGVLAGHRPVEGRA